MSYSQVFDDRQHAYFYRFKVGDICFIAIGQITNRPYKALRYQRTGCHVVNSTVRDKLPAAEVRAIWGKADHRRKLLDFLLTDLEGPVGFDESGAAMRLTYYFPEAAEEIIAARLQQRTGRRPRPRKSG